MARSKSRNIADLVGDRGSLTLNSNNLSSTFSDIDLTGTGSLTLPVGTTAQRDGSPAVGMMRYNSTLNVFEGYKSGAWSEIGGGSSDTWNTDKFTGNGSTAAYALSIAPASEDNVIAFIEGVFQNPADYALSGTTITFEDNVPTGHQIVVHTVKATVSGNNLNQDAFTGDNSTTAFTLSINPIDENNTMVYIDGVYQNKSTYSLSNQVLHFSTAPATAAAIEVLTFTQTTINAPTTNSVSTASLIDDSVTSAKLGHVLTLQGDTTISGGHLNLDDNKRLNLGADQDLQIYHTGGFSVIKDRGTGDLEIQTNGSEIQLTGNAGTDYMARFISNGAVKLYYDNVNKFETTTTGVTANGIVTATTFSGDLNGTINTATTATTQANSVASTTVATTAFVTNKVAEGKISPALTGTPSAPTAANTVSTTQLATTAYVSNKLTELIGGAPSTLNDLNELAAAINDDASYNTTLTSALATKLPLAGGTLTGALVGTTLALNSGATNVVASFTSTDGVAGIQLADNGGNVELSAQGNDFHIQNAGAAAKMVVRNNGTVGIGTTTPGEKLEVNGIIQIKRAGDHPAMRFVEDTTTRAYMGSGDWAVNGLADADFGISSVGKLALGTSAGSGRLYILGTGEVGIGTATPAASLDVLSNDSSDYIAIFKQAHASNLGTVKIDSPSDESARPSRLDFARGGTVKWKTGMVYADNTHGWGLSDATGSGTAVQQTRFLVKPDGTSIVNYGNFNSLPTGSNLNVFGDGEVLRLDGTSSTSRTLRFRNTGTNGSQNAIIISDGTLQLKNEDANAAMYFNSVRNMDFQVTSGNGTAGHMTFSSYNTEIMRIDGASNYVGIGVTDPDSKLEIKGAGGGSGFTLKTTDASSNETFYVQDGGRVGLNYWPLTVGIPSGTSAASNAKFQVEESGAFTVLTNGNVGVGLTAPNHPLSVSRANAKIAAHSTADSQTIGFQAKYLDHSTLYGSFEYTTGDAQLYIDNNFVGNNGNYSDINLRNKDTSGNFHNRIKIKGSTGRVGIGDTAPTEKLRVSGSTGIFNGHNDLASHTHAIGSVVSSGKINGTVGYSGTYAANKTWTFTYAATTWKSWQATFRIASTCGFAVMEAGGYWNNGGPLNVVEVADSNTVATLTVTNSGQGLVFTITLNTTHIHPFIEWEYRQSGGDGAPRMDRMSLVQA